MAKKKTKEYKYALHVNGTMFMTGDKHSIGVLFGNLTGVNFSGKVNPQVEHAEWLAYMAGEFKADLPVGGAIEMLSPDGNVLHKSSVGDCIQKEALA